MVLDFGVSSLPMAVFMVVHISAFAIGLALAFRSQLAVLRSAFLLFSAAELLYMGYHLAITTFLLSHTLAEALDLAAFILAFVGYSQWQRSRSPRPARAQG